MDEQDRLIVAKVIAGEAAGEGAPGMKAVACVIEHRMAAKRLTAYEVVTAPSQFSAFKDIAMCERNYKDVAPIADALAYLLERGCFFDIIDDMVCEARHYVTWDCWKRPTRPIWLESMRIVKTVGNHVFLKEIAR